LKQEKNAKFIARLANYHIVVGDVVYFIHYCTANQLRVMWDPQLCAEAAWLMIAALVELEQTFSNW